MQPILLNRQTIGIFVLGFFLSVQVIAGQQSAPRPSLKTLSSNTESANKTKTQLRAEKRIESMEAIDLQGYTTKPGITIEEGQKKLNELQQNKSQQLIIDINKAIQDSSNDKTIKPKISTTNSALNAVKNLKLGDQYLPISIMQARQRALQNNLNIAVIKFDPLIAQETLNFERAKFDNIIFANAKYGLQDLPKNSAELVNLSSDNATLNNQTVKLNNVKRRIEAWDAEVGIDIPLRTGGTVTLSSPLAFKEGLGRFGKEEYNSALRFSISQPLLRDAGIATNEASINIANLAQQGTELRTRLQSIRILATVDKAYWALNQAWVQLEIRTQQYQYAAENLDMVKKRVKEGLTARIEINRAEIGVADRMEQLIIATTNLQLNERQLKFFLNDNEYPMESEKGFITETVPSLIQFELNADRLIEKAMTTRLELLELEIKLSEDSTRISFLENQTLPIFNLDYKYGALSNTGDQLSQSYNQIGNFSQWYVGFRFEMPVTNEARLARLNQAITQRMQRLSTNTLQTMAVRKEILDALDLQNQHWTRILTARQQVIIAGINYDAELKQFKEGLRTMTEVLEMLTRLGEVQLKEISAVTDYQVAQIDLAFATGTLLGYSRVNFE